MADAVAISSTPFSGEGGRGAGGLIQTLAISEGEMDRRQANNKEELKTFTQFPHMTFKRLQLWHNMWLTFFLIHCTVGVCACVKHVSPTLGIKLPPLAVSAPWPDSLNYTRLHFISSYFPSSCCLSFGIFFFFCPTLGVPPVVCHAKIAQLLLHRQRS